MFQPNKLIFAIISLQIFSTSYAFADNFQGLRLGTNISHVPAVLERWCETFERDSSNKRFVGESCNQNVEFPVFRVEMYYSGLLSKSINQMSIYYSEKVGTARVLQMLGGHFEGNYVTYSRYSENDCISFSEDDGTKTTVCEDVFVHNERRDFFNINEYRTAHGNFVLLTMIRE